MTKGDIQNGVNIMLAAVHAIQAAGTMPSGHLYGMLASRLTFEAYQSMVRLILKTNLVKQEGDTLVWVG